MAPAEDEPAPVSKVLTSRAGRAACNGPSTGKRKAGGNSCWRKLELILLLGGLGIMFLGFRVYEAVTVHSLLGDLTEPKEQRLRVFVREEDVAAVEASAEHKPHAVVSTLYSDDYIDGLRVLGYSLTLQNVTATKVAMYIPGQVTEETLCLARQVGWEMRPVERIAPLQGVRDHFKDQYTKLHVWELEEFSRVVYLDADTLVIGPIDALFSVPHAFAAVPDIYDTGYTSDFNAGVLSLRPSVKVFKALMKALPKLGFDRYEAEQAFLREYYRADVMLLPYKYNLNLAQLKHEREDWDTIWSDGRVIHFTLYKPFKYSRTQSREEDGELSEFRMAFDRWWEVYDQLNEVTARRACAGASIQATRHRLLP